MHDARPGPTPRCTKSMGGGVSKEAHKPSPRHIDERRPEAMGQGSGRPPCWESSAQSTHCLGCKVRGGGRETQRGRHTEATVVVVN